MVYEAVIALLLEVRYIRQAMIWIRIARALCFSIYEEQHLAIGNLCRGPNILEGMRLSWHDTPQRSRRVSSDTTPTGKHFGRYQTTYRRATNRDEKQFAARHE
jgi:hypothetical protein